MIKYIMSDLSEVIMQGYMGVGQELSPILNIPVEEIELEKTKNYTKEYTEKLKQRLAEKTESLNLENLTNPNKDSDKSLKN